MNALLTHFGLWNDVRKATRPPAHTNMHMHAHGLEGMKRLLGHNSGRKLSDIVKKFMQKCGNAKSC